MTRFSIMCLMSVLALAGCASPRPANYATTLSIQDPKWESPECREIRLAALGYDDKVGERMAIGVASGLLLGPLGIPIAVAADMDQDQKRRLFSREVHLRCSSLPLPDDLKETKPATVNQNEIDNT